MGLYIPDTVADSGVSYPAMLLYGRVANYARQSGACWESNATLSADLRCKKRALQGYLGELEEAGFINVEYSGYSDRKIYPVHNDAPLRHRKLSTNHPRQIQRKLLPPTPTPPTTPR